MATTLPFLYLWILIILLSDTVVFSTFDKCYILFVKALPFAVQKKLTSSIFYVVSDVTKTNVFFCRN